MLRNQWVNLFIWYAVGLLSALPALVFYIVRSTSLYPLSWRGDAITWDQATAYAIGLLIVIGANDYFQSRYVLRRDNYSDPREMQFSFDSVYIDEGEYWSHLAVAWSSLVVKCLLAFGALYCLNYLFPPLQP